MFSIFGYKSFLKISFLWAAVVTDVTCSPSNSDPSPFVVSAKSACAASTTTSSPTTTVCASPTTPSIGILYGDFECGLGLWTLNVPDPAATAMVVNPSSTRANTGNSTFQVIFNPPSISQTPDGSVQLTSPLLTVTPEVTYELDFNTWFFTEQAGFVGVLINEDPIYDTVAPINSGGGNWFFNTVNWTAPAGVTTASIRIDFFFGGPSLEQEIDMIDTVLFGRAPL